jgi:GNAT superfamily N-acetyltransferase
MTSSSRIVPRAAGRLAEQRLGLSDAVEAAEVIRAAFAVQPRATEPPSSALRETAATVAEKLLAGGRFGLRADGWLAALVLWEAAGGAVHVARLSVLPEWRGQGLSRRLVGLCEDGARARGFARMTLRVRLTLSENERLFERLGFRRIGVETHKGFEAPTVAVMEKRLP